MMTRADEAAACKKADEIEIAEKMKKMAEECQKHWRTKTFDAFNNATPEEQKRLYFDLYDTFHEKTWRVGRIMYLFSVLCNMDSVSRVMFQDLVHLGVVVNGILQLKGDIPFIDDILNEFFEKYPELKQ